MERLLFLLLLLLLLLFVTVTVTDTDIHNQISLCYYYSIWTTMIKLWMNYVEFVEICWSFEWTM